MTRKLQRNFLIQTSPTWKYHVGLGYGFHQPILQSSIQINPEIVKYLPTIQDRYINIISKSGVPFDAPSLPSSIKDVGEWLMIWLHTFQAVNKIPLFEVGKVVASSSNDSGYLTQRFVTPYCHPISTQHFMGCLVALANILEDDANNQQIKKNLDVVERKLSLIIKQSSFLKIEGINIERILRVTLRENIPFANLVNKIYVIGQGIFVRWLNSTFTDKTSHLGAITSKNKIATGEVLRRHGLPVPNHMIVHDEQDALQKAEKLGYPVVIKPVDRDGGLGVHAGLQNPDQLKRCLKEAMTHSSNIMVEKHFYGRDYRLTVFNGRLIKAIERRPGGVVGDGTSTVKDLVSSTVNSPENLRRIRERGKQLLSLDAEAIELLAELGLGVDQIPELNRFIPLRRRSNVSTGGTTRLVTSIVHADNAELAERVANIMRLDIAGIDLLIPDIASSWLETGASICEVNAQPQISENNSPGLYLDMLHELLQGDGRIPIVIFVYQESTNQEEINKCLDSLSSIGDGTLVVMSNQLRLNEKIISKKLNNYVVASQAAIINIEAKRVFVWVKMNEVLEHGVPAACIDHLVLFEQLSDIHSDAFSTLSELITPHLKNLYHHEGDGFAKFLGNHGCDVPVKLIGLPQLSNREWLSMVLGRKA